MSEIEIVQYSKIDGMTAFFNNVAYRSAHLHSEWELIWIIENSMMIICDGDSFVANEGDILLFSPSLIHEFKKIDESCTFMCLQVSPEFLGISSLTMSSSVHLDEYICAEDLIKIRTCLFKMMKKYVMQDNLFQVYCKGKCALLMYSILSKMPMSTLSSEENTSRSKKNERLVRLIDFVNENYTHKVKLYEFAEKEGVTLCYMSHFIQANLGQSFQDYVNTVRFNHACSLIAKGNMKMSEIYKESGFSDYKYFVKTFLEKSGKSPDEYSKSLSSNVNKVKDSSLSVGLRTEERFFNREESIALLDKLGEARKKAC